MWRSAWNLNSGRQHRLKSVGPQQASWPGELFIGGGLAPLAGPERPGIRSGTRCPNVRQPRRTSRPTDLRNPETPPPRLLYIHQPLKAVVDGDIRAAGLSDRTAIRDHRLVRGHLGDGATPFRPSAPATSVCRICDPESLLHPSGTHIQPSDSRTAGADGNNFS